MPNGVLKHFGLKRSKVGDMGARGALGADVWGYSVLWGSNWRGTYMIIYVFLLHICVYMYVIHVLRNVYYVDLTLVAGQFDIFW